MLPNYHLLREPETTIESDQTIEYWPPDRRIQWMSGWDWEVRNFRSQRPRDLGCAVVYLQNVQLVGGFNPSEEY